MLIKIAAMFSNLLIFSFNATIRVKKAFCQAPASRGFASHVFLVIIIIKGAVSPICDVTLNGQKKATFALTESGVKIMVQFCSQ